MERIGKMRMQNTHSIKLNSKKCRFLTAEISKVEIYFHFQFSSSNVYTKKKTYAQGATESEKEISVYQSIC